MKTSTAAFPDVSTLEKSQSGDEYIYGGSVGINRILGHLRDTAFLSSAPKYGLFLINTLTLLDNVYDKGTKNEAELYKAFLKEVEMLCMYIEAYASVRKIPYTPTIVFYAPTYERLPSQVRRDNSNNANGRVQALHDVLRPQLAYSPTDISVTDASQRWIVPVGSAGLPHKDIVAWLRGKAGKLHYIQSQDQVALITHCVIDLYIHLSLPKVQLLERYTGQVKQPSTFGSKLGVGNHVPFNMYTHRAFGDKIHIKPLVQGIKKTNLLTVAEKNKWTRLSQDLILNDLVKHTGLPATSFSSVKF